MNTNYSCRNDSSKLLVTVIVVVVVCYTLDDITRTTIKGIDFLSN